MPPHNISTRIFLILTQNFHVLFVDSGGEAKIEVKKEDSDSMKLSKDGKSFLFVLLDSKLS